VAAQTGHSNSLPSDPLGGPQSDCACVLNEANQIDKVCVLHAANQTDKLCMLHAANQTNKVCVLHAANQAQAEGSLRDSCHVPDQDRS